MDSEESDGTSKKGMAGGVAQVTCLLIYYPRDCGSIPREERWVSPMKLVALICCPNSSQSGAIQTRYDLPRALVLAR